MSQNYSHHNKDALPIPEIFDVAAPTGNLLLSSAADAGRERGWTDGRGSAAL